MSEPNARSDKEYFNGEWLREATMPEDIMETSHKHGNFLVWCQLELKSTLPLQEEHVRQAVAHLYRKVPSLGVCYGDRDGTRWIKKASNPNIDFKVLEGQRVEEVRESIRNHRYDSDTGPLFCVRMLKDSPDRIDDPDNLEPGMHHSTHIFFGLHHGITDGRSNYVIFGFFISLLNDVISNKPIDDTEQLGTFVSPEITMSILTEMSASLEADASLRAKLENENDMVSKLKPQLVYNFLKEPGEVRRTFTIDTRFDRETTAKFIQKCKMEKVTVHSALMGITNRAIVDLLVEDGGVQDSYVILSSHTIDARRYWAKKIPNALGIHITPPLMVCTSTPKNLDGKFWDYVRSIHSPLKKEIEDRKSAMDFAFQMLQSPSDDPPYSEKYLLSEKDYRCDYETANIGEVTPFVTEEGKHVRIIHIIQSTCNLHSENPILMGFHTLRGKLAFIIDFNPAVVKEDVAQKLLSQMSTRLKDSILQS